MQSWIKFVFSWLILHWSHFSSFIVFIFRQKNQKSIALNIMSNSLLYSQIILERIYSIWYTSREHFSMFTTVEKLWSELSSPSRSFKIIDTGDSGGSLCRSRLSIRQRFLLNLFRNYFDWFFLLSERSFQKLLPSSILLSVDVKGFSLSASDETIESFHLDRITELSHEKCPKKFLTHENMISNFL